MLDISRTGQITMTRGDDISFCLFLDSGNNLELCRYELNDDDIIYFGVMEPGKDFECALIRKAYKKVIREDEENKFLPVEYDDEDNDIIIRINNEDTINLLEGDYYYSIKLVRAIKDELGNIKREEVNTVVGKTKFSIV